MAISLEGPHPQQAGSGSLMVDMGTIIWLGEKGADALSTAGHFLHRRSDWNRGFRLIHHPFVDRVKPSESVASGRPDTAFTIHIIFIYIYIYIY